jgi:hypothetical protein
MFRWWRETPGKQVSRSVHSEKKVSRSERREKKVSRSERREKKVSRSEHFVKYFYYFHAR